MGKQVVFTVMAGSVLEREKRRMGIVFQALARFYQHMFWQEKKKYEQTNV